MGTYAISVAGGEPLIHKDFKKIIKYIRSKGLEVTIITNGHLLDKNIIEFLFEYGITNVGVSFHSINEEEYCDIFKVGSKEFKNAINSIRRMVDIGIHTSIACTVGNYNYDNITEMTNFFQNLGIKHDNISFNNLMDGKRDIRNESVSDLEYFTIMSLRGQNEKSVKYDSRFCIAGRSSITINYDGEVQICSFIGDSIGNINKHNIKSLWENSSSLIMLRSITEEHFQICRECMIKEKCRICIAKNIVRERNIFKIPKEYCNAMLLSFSV